MPGQNDFRTKNSDELTFYVFDNLRGKQPELYRYDNVKEAVKKYMELPSDYTTAIGCSIHEYSEVDLVHRVNGEAVKVMDYSRMDRFSGREDVLNAVKELENGLHIRYQYVSGIHPRRSVLSPLENGVIMDSYLNNKVLDTSRNKYSQSMFSSINEVYVEGKGWLGGREFINTFPDDAYTNPVAPVVSKLNVQYKETDTGYLGQCDISPANFEKMIKKTKDYHLSFADKVASKSRPSIDEKINEAEKELVAGGGKDKPIEKVER